MWQVIGMLNLQQVANCAIGTRKAQPPPGSSPRPPAGLLTGFAPPPQICHPGSFSLICDKLPGVLCRLPCSVMLEDHSTIGPVGGTVLAVAHAFAVGGCRVTGSA